MAEAEQIYLFAFACNTKRFAVAILSFFCFFFPGAVFGRTVKSFLWLFNLSLPKTRLTSTGSVSPDTLGNIFVDVLSTIISSVGGQYLFNIHEEFFRRLLRMSYEASV